jgi:hypothetical protein
LASLDRQRAFHAGVAVPRDRAVERVVAGFELDLGRGRALGDLVASEPPGSAVNETVEAPPVSPPVSVSVASVAAGSSELSSSSSSPQAATANGTRAISAISTASFVFNSVPLS